MTTFVEGLRTRLCALHTCDRRPAVSNARQGRYPGPCNSSSGWMTPFVRRIFARSETYTHKTISLAISVRRGILTPDGRFRPAASF